MRVLVVNGPNLNLLGTREPEIYGNTSLAQIEEMMRREAEALGVSLRFVQSNHEGDLIEAIHSAKAGFDGIIINAGAYTHYSLALHDALKAVGLPTVEVHISNIYAREEARRRSVIAPATIGGIYGMGPAGYVLALKGLVLFLEKGEKPGSK